MGRKRWWRGGLELLVLFILHHATLGDGDVGCLFSNNVCDRQTETCYNDLAFGKCVPIYGNSDEKDFYQYNLSSEDLEMLRLELERLEIDGYKWNHPYTQCLMQTSLYNFREGYGYSQMHKEKYDLRLCEHLRQHERFGYGGRIDGKTRVPAIAIVKFMPNNGNSESDFANELYYPPATQNRYVRRTLYDNDFLRLPYVEKTTAPIQQFYGPRYALNSFNEYDSLTGDDAYEEPGRTVRKKSMAYDVIDDDLYGVNRQPPTFKEYTVDALRSIKNALEVEKLARRIQEHRDPSYLVKTLPDDQLEFLTNEKPADDFAIQRYAGVDPDVEYERAFARKYKHPRKVEGDELLGKDESWLDNVKRNLKIDRSLNYEAGDYTNINGEVEVPQNDVPSKESGMYTEGGLVQAQDDRSESDGKPTDALFDDDLEDFLWKRELAGFKRRERLDVKKPGPPFSTNNYAFKNQFTNALENENHSEENQDDAISQNDVLLSPLVKKELGSNPQVLDDAQKTYQNVDLDHVYMEFQNPFHKWSEGEHVVKEVGKLLELQSGSLRDIRVGRAEVTFKVTRNNKNYDATDVLNNIDDIRGKLRENLGVEVIRAGIGDKAKLPAALVVSAEPEMSSSLFGAVVAAGVAAAAAAAVVTLVIARRHAKSRAKLAGLSTPDPEASKDYQDLCRARMQAKQPTDKPESPRITTLSRESESNNLPSNRSSTSSWGEEPSLSNIDISTGHMVLSYMEDHLKNKDRLDQEWAALCAYEADPSSVEIAENETNVKKNRPGAAVPYDHSRIVLNYLANANNSDYINASTITDHDPRNPAYIATQGPLPQTTADFWQLVWEQGSVVIVMLTRLTEEGIAMCHRYWPEEGSELYHIYEVHLVSEHFWCDDYLVRSFYLKNLRTGETRTVTQFHFLSWPENDVPHSTKALLEFRRKVNKSYRGRSCPIVVHCSDGAGRTGTYSLIDMVLNRMMKGAKEIDIAATLEHIRDQRPDMVHTKQQFEFVLMAVAEEMHAILRALPAPPAEKSPPPAESSSSPKAEQ